MAVDQKTFEIWKAQARRDDWHQTFVGSDIRQMLGEIDSLHGTLRYIAAQAKAGHAGALRVIQSNAEAALRGEFDKVRDMLAASRAGEQVNGERP